jgi:hypothetical protein
MTSIPTIKPMTCEEAIVEMCKAKVWGRNSSAGIMDIIFNYMNSNPEANLPELEIKLREKEIANKAKVEGYHSTRKYLIYLGEQIASGLNKWIDFHPVHNVENDENYKVCVYVIEFIQKIAKKQANLIYREDHRIYLIASQEPIAPSAKRLDIRDPSKETLYNLLVSTKSKEESDQIRQKNAGSVEENLRKLNQTGMVVETYGDSFFNSELPKRDWTLSAFGSYLFLLELKSTPEKIETKITDLLAIKEKCPAEEFNEKVSQTVDWLNAIINFKLNGKKAEIFQEDVCISQEDICIPSETFTEIRYYANFAKEKAKEALETIQSWNINR